MTDLISKQEVNKLLNDILIENRITYKEVYDCAKWRRKEIMNMMSIFDRKNDRDIRLSLEILCLLAQTQGDKVLDLYGNEYGFTSIVEDLHKNIPKEDKILLLTACMYNPLFQSFTVGFCEDIKLLLDVKKDVPDTEDITQREYEVEEITQKEYENGIVTIIIFTFNRPIKLIEHDDATPASDDGNGVFENILIKEIKYSNPTYTIEGTLFLKGKGGKEKRAYLEFVINDRKKIDKERIPFELKFCFKPTHDSPKEIIADNPRKDKTGKIIIAINSGIINNIDFSGGIEAKSKLHLRLLPKQYGIR